MVLADRKNVNGSSDLVDAMSWVKMECMRTTVRCRLSACELVPGPRPVVGPRSTGLSRPRQAGRELKFRPKLLLHIFLPFTRQTPLVPRPERPRQQLELSSRISCRFYGPAMASGWFGNKAIELVRARSLFVNVSPAPKSLSERRAVLHALKRHGSIEVFKRLPVSYHARHSTRCCRS